MKTGHVVTMIIAAMGIEASLARADARTDAIVKAGTDLSEYWQLSSDPGWSEVMIANPKRQPSACTAVIADATKAGVQPTDVLRGNFYTHPKGDKKSGSLAFSEANEVCTAYAAMFKLEQLAMPIRTAASQYRSPLTLEAAKPYSEGATTKTIESAKACIASLDRAFKEGVAESSIVEVANKEMTLGDGKKVCQEQLAHAEAFGALIVEAHKADQAEKGKKYEAVGISGEKLALMIEYDSVYWMVKGCTKEDAPAKLAKAKVLFQWLENADGTHTIRRYQFKGNKVAKTTEKTYNTQAAAYKGCK